MSLRPYKLFQWGDLVMLLKFNSHCFYEHFYFSIWASDLKINLSGSKNYSSWTSGPVLRYWLFYIISSVFVELAVVTFWPTFWYCWSASSFTIGLNDIISGHRWLYLCFFFLLFLLQSITSLKWFNIIDSIHTAKEFALVVY